MYVYIYIYIYTTLMSCTFWKSARGYLGYAVAVRLI